MRRTFMKEVNPMRGTLIVAVGSLVGWLLYRSMKKPDRVKTMLRRVNQNIAAGQVFYRLVSKYAKRLIHQVKTAG